MYLYTSYTRSALFMAFFLCTATGDSYAPRSGGGDALNAGGRSVSNRFRASNQTRRVSGQLVSGNTFLQTRLEGILIRAGATEARTLV